MAGGAPQLGSPHVGCSLAAVAGGVVPCSSSLGTKKQLAVVTFSLVVTSYVIPMSCSSVCAAVPSLRGSSSAEGGALTTCSTK